jgi:hypothetical protein
MKKLTLSILFLLAHTVLYAQGLAINDNAYRTVPQKKSNQAVTKLPSKIDLSMYVPTVIDQGNLGTCVGMSVGYYMRTILEAKRLGITNKKEIDKRCFSPSFLYNSIKAANDDSCLKGADIGVALEYIKKNGLVRLTEQKYPDCKKNTKIALKEDSKILDYIKIFDLIDREENVAIATKKALSEYCPVVVGVQTTNSMSDLSFKKTLLARTQSFFGISAAQADFTLWKPANSNSLSYGHAMCVVGYDDQKFGGSFLIVNSWGDYWGDNGYFWITYTDYAKYVKYGYQAYLQSANDKSKIILSADLTIAVGSFVTDTDEPVERSKAGTKLVAYSLRNPQLTGTPYKFNADVSKQTYLYMIAANGTENITTKLFPTDGVSPIIGANTKVSLPNDALIKLIEPKGTEYWLFLFSEKPINIDDYILKINEAKGPFTDRVVSAFGNDLAPYQQVNYKDKKMGFFLKSQYRGRIVPLLVSMNHI